MRRIIALALVLGVAGNAAWGNPFHTADENKDGRITLPELLRIIQFYNSNGYHCKAGTEDGYSPGPGAHDCVAHESDYVIQDWNIDISELLRIIQFYNGAGYFECKDGEDGYCFLATRTRPNVVFLILDALKDDRIDATRDGHKVMPFLSEFAAGGTRFKRAWSAGTWTHPGMAGLFSGMYCDRFAKQTDPDGNAGQATHFILPDSVETVAEWLGKHGYDNWGTQCNKNGQAVWGYAQGFPDAQFDYVNFQSAFVVAADVMENQPQWQEPFMVFAQYVDPHGPYTPPIDEPYPFAAEAPLSGSDANSLNFAWGGFSLDKLEAFFGAHPSTYPDLTPTGVSVLQGRYDRECYYLDDILSTFITGIQAQYPNTIFVITADHGEALFDRDISGHGHQSYEELTRVPFIIRGPGVPVGVDNRRVSTISLMPTLARIIGVSTELHWEGHDLLYDGKEEPIYAYTKSTFSNIQLETSCVVDGDLKYIQDTKYVLPQLYDLAADPTERNNLATLRPNDVTRLKAMLDAHHAQVGTLE